MKKFKFAAALVLAVTALVFTSCDLLNQLLDKGALEKTANEIKRNDQDIITMGVYPQSEKSENVEIISQDTTRVNGWDCYAGSDGEKYVKLDIETTENGETTTETKYYKIEPLKWRVLTTDYNGTGKKLLFCEKLIDCCDFIDYECPETRDIDYKTIYENNYQFSRVRAFLNGTPYMTEEFDTGSFGYQIQIKKDFSGKGFMQLAFNTEEKARIATTLVDNSTGVNSKYKCDDTRDKIFLLSKKEIQKTEYGFPTEEDELDYPARSREATDFARARGRISKSITTYSLLRTPSSKQNTVWQVSNVKFEYNDETYDERGKLDDGTILKGSGLVPALCLNNDIPAVLSSSEVIDIYYRSKAYTKPEECLSADDYYDKHANVYLPAGYDKNDTSTKYPLVLLLHGMGCNEDTWGLQDPYGQIRKCLDEGIASGEITKCIVVSANGIADNTWGPGGRADSRDGCNAFGNELRYTLLPYLMENFNILEGRENVAMAGFSMGAEQTMNLGIGECLDLISYFGAFGACPHVEKGNPDAATLYPAIFINDVENRFTDTGLTIKKLYIAVGEKDEQFRPNCEAYSEAMPDWTRVEDFGFDIVEGQEHDWETWLFGFEHFLPMVFK